MLRIATPLFLLLSAFASAQYPVACYPFVAGSGADASGNGFNGTVVGAVAVPDRAGTPEAALDFNGTTDYVVIGALGNLVPTDEFSVSFWLKADGSNSDAAIMTVPDDIYDRLCIAPHYNHTGGNTVFWDYGNIFDNGRAAIIPYTFSPDWTHWVFVHSAVQNRMSIYVNGVLADEELHHSAIVDRTKPVYIGGGMASGGADFHFHGAIDDVQFYDVALGSAFVANLYAAQVNVFTCSQVGIGETSPVGAAHITWNGHAVAVDWPQDRTGELDLFDAEGRRVLHRSTLSGDRWLVPVQGLAAGLYAVHCRVNGQESAGKVLVD
jgi:hypothetical protein